MKMRRQNWWEAPRYMTAEQKRAAAAKRRADAPRRQLNEVARKLVSMRRENERKQAERLAPLMKLQQVAGNGGTHHNGNGEPLLPPPPRISAKSLGKRFEDHKSNKNKPQGGFDQLR